MPIKIVTFGAFLLGCYAVAIASSGGAFAKSGFHVVHDFNYDEGHAPYSGLIADNAGNLYGTTRDGGAQDGGIVFKLSPDGTLTTLHTFDFGGGYYPRSGLIIDQSGSLYGTTTNGGSGCNCGVAFKLAPDGTETVLHAFKGKGDGHYPASELVMDREGNLFGTTSSGGDRFCDCGVVFKIAPDETETILHVFKGGDNDGAYPAAGLTIAGGKLYGTTTSGGSGGEGAVFKLAPDGTVNILHSFSGPDDGLEPDAPLIADRQGNLYGTTVFGTGTGCILGGGCGTIFKITPDGQETILYTFKGGSDGFMPEAALLMDSDGNLYGTTSAGGGGKYCEQGSRDMGCGTVFKLAKDGTETVLHAFSNGYHAAVPWSRLIADKKGRLYGTTSGGQFGQSTIFRIAP